MYVGYVKDGMNNYLNLKYHNLEKMGRILYLYILILKSTSLGLLIYQILKLNIKLWYHLRNISIFLLGIINNF